MGHRGDREMKQFERDHDYFPITDDQDRMNKIRSYRRERMRDDMWIVPILISTIAIIISLIKIFG